MACLGVLGCAAAARAQTPACDATAGQATLLETVTDRTSRVPLAGATVIASWRNDGEHEVRVRTDSAGKALICAPAGRPILLSVAYHEIRSAGERAVLTHSRATSHTYSVDVPGVFVRGLVLDRETGAPLANVAVRIANAPLTVFTNGDGRFIFERVPLGDHALRFEHLSYAVASAPLRVRADDLDATIRLAADAIPLAPITVTAFSRRLDRVGFYERERRGVGTFINRRQIDVMNVQSASELLRGVPGARIIPQNPRRNALRNTTAGRGNCRFRFIVDGSRTLPDFEMDFVAPYAIEGLEVYRGLAEVPAEFRAIVPPDGGANCGVIAIWTREGR